MSTKNTVCPETGLDMELIGSPTGKSRIMKLIPLPLLVRMRALKNHRILKKALRYDSDLYEKFSSSTITGDTKEKLSALITLSYHGIEKGLSLPSPRPLFGRSNIKRLALRLERYISAFGHDKTSEVALDTLKEYRRFNIEKHGKKDRELDEILSDLDAMVVRSNRITSLGGTKTLTREEIFKNSKIDLESFYQFRSSIRNYTNDPVANESIELAVRMAQKTPSVCNRQSSRVLAVTERERIAELLELQGGAAGFKDRVPCLLIISSDLSCFQSPGERYQCWVDGGLFAMSLIYALHSLGLGTCCLNWSKYPEDDLQLYEKVPSIVGERVIMFLAVGHIPEAVNVPLSASPCLNDVLRWDS